ncbi:hypothetical protein BU15DRAFT_75725 [Melanogaster broomeanus]|nr:hypothetical protein BU15DRAFT_75725 [Melanogaster broomeanus]
MVSNTLRANIRKRKALIDAKGPDASGVGRLELEICLQITNEREKEILRRRAIANEWPMVIDFSSLLNRIAKADLQDELTGLLFVSIEVETNDIFCNLIDDLIELGLGKTSEEALSKFSKLPMSSVPRIIVEKARPGYYGPKGYAVIRASIMRLTDPTTTSTEAFAPLTIEQFTHFILIPHIARRLIAEDLDVTLMEAFEEMAASGEVGKYLQELDDTGDDEVLDNITMNTVVDQRRKVARAKRTDRRVEDAPAPSTAGTGSNKPRPKPRPVMKLKPLLLSLSTKELSGAQQAVGAFLNVCEANLVSLGKGRTIELPRLSWRCSSASNGRGIKPEAKNSCTISHSALILFR